MSAPKRIQLSRQKGYRKPEGAVNVARPGRWGNPFAVQPVDSPSLGRMWGIFLRQKVDGRVSYLGPLSRWDTRPLAIAEAVDRFRTAVQRGEGNVPWPAEIRAELAGKDLACWCKVPAPGEPDICHGSVLLAIANSEPTP